MEELWAEPAETVEVVGAEATPVWALRHGIEKAKLFNY
jgi:hypothetical protein